MMGIVVSSRATGAAGGVLTGSYPDPAFAEDMATQAELDAKYVDAILVVSLPKTADYTLVASDYFVPSAIDFNSASNLTLTVPTNAAVAYPVGTCFEVTRLGAGTVTVAGDVGVTVRSPGGSLTLRAQYSTGALRKIGTDEWVLSGDLT